jgi:serine/threonine protein kinase
MDTLGYDQVPARNTNAVLGDSYIIGRRLGRGAMGEVYEAQHVRLPGQFAVKLLLPELQGNQEAFARFCREAEIMSQLRHPNIVQIFDFNVAPDARPYFVMEYLQGRDLETRLQAGSLPLPAVTRIVDAVGSALGLAHAHGVVHRDLKPANIFLATVDGQTDELVKVLDFGISKVRSAAAQISQAVDLLGTPSYMSPEQARGQGDAIDGRTDQFALGAIAYRMLTGQEPFQGDDTAAVLYQVVHEDPPPLSLFLPSSWDPGPLQAVLNRALAKRPEHRFGGMLELARAFDDAAERTIGTPRSAGPPPADGDRSREGAQALPARALRGGGGPRSGSRDETDEPPPVRTPAPVLASAPRRLPALKPAPVAAARPPVAPGRPAVAPDRPQIIDWELPSEVDRPPVTHVKGAALGLLALAIAATLLVTGWYKKLPAVGAAMRQRIHEWTRPAGGEAGTPAAPAPAPAPEAASAPESAPAPESAAPDRAPRGGTANVQPGPEPAAKSAAAATATAPAVAPPTRRAPAAEPAPAATAETARAPHRPAKRNHRPRTPQFAQPPAPASVDRNPPAQVAPGGTPPLNGRAFEIAPPTTAPIEPSRDLAPASDDDGTPPPAPPSPPAPSHWPSR